LCKVISVWCSHIRKLTNIEISIFLISEEETKLFR
jgi:hypothetical protein